ncbi:MAG: CinA family protein [Gemmatimonadota bacterium]
MSGTEDRARRVLALLAVARRTVAVAESCTGGGLGAALTAIPGSSEAFVGGAIAYSDAMKRRLLGVDPATLSRHGAVSGDAAVAMAVGVRALTGADWGVAVTGIAGPGGGSPGKPVGTVWGAVAGPDGSPPAVRWRFDGDRAAVRAASVDAALDLLADRLDPGAEPDA